jgi:hypothetical protein
LAQAQQQKPQRPSEDRPINSANFVVKWQPNAGPQTQARDTLADITGFGGRAGGGKSNLLVGLAATQHLKSIIFRREAVQVEDLFSKLKEVVGNDGTRQSPRPRWESADGKQRITLAGLKDPGDWEDWKGHEFDFMGFDEVTEILETQVRYLMGWNRTTVKGQRCRIVFTFNPPTSQEGMWVLEFFAAWLDPNHPNPAQPGELRWYAMLDGKETEVQNGEVLEYKGESIKPKSRTFIPASLADNPYLKDTDYGSTLQALPEPLRSQLLYGDFQAGVKEDIWQVIPSAWVEAAQARWSSSPPTELHQLGVDVARGGQDYTVIIPRHGMWFGKPVKIAGKDTPDGDTAASQVVKYYQRGATVNVDVIGYGSSCYDVLKGQLGEDVAIPINVASRADNNAMDKSGKLKFINLRAQIYWQFREALDPRSGSGIALPPGKEIKQDLCSAKWTLLKEGIKIESKLDIKPRLGRSPDVGDALLLAWYTKQVGEFGYLDEGVSEFLLDFRGI